MDGQTQWLISSASLPGLQLKIQKLYHPIELQYPMHITQRKRINALREKLYFFSLSVCHLMLLDINVTAVVSKLC